MKKPEYYRYPAIVSPDGDGWTVTFPDIDNCFTSADTVEEAIVEAQAVLEDCMYFREAQKDVIPEPTCSQTLSCPAGGFVQMVVAVMGPVRKAWSRRAVKKTLTIPAWMEEELKKHEDVNISLVLQRAIKKELGLKEPLIR
ncbi:MAG: type II toxin-antitoxin system HicB family antitoxin [Synergistota bacterium]|nr:type II toxin-antitoxin system HicB family antitoxin [Synergistota bacterium]